MISTLRTCCSLETRWARGSCLSLIGLDDSLDGCHLELVVIYQAWLEAIPSVMSTRRNQTSFHLLLHSARHHLLLVGLLLVAIVGRLELATVFDGGSWHGSLATLGDESSALGRVKVAFLFLVSGFVSVEVVEKQVILLFLGTDNRLNRSCINIIPFQIRILDLILLQNGPFTSCWILLIKFLENWLLN